MATAVVWQVRGAPCLLHQFLRQVCIITSQLLFSTGEPMTLKKKGKKEGKGEGNNDERSKAAAKIELHTQLAGGGSRETCMGHGLV